MKLEELLALPNREDAIGRVTVDCLARLAVGDAKAITSTMTFAHTGQQEWPLGIGQSEIPNGDKCAEATSRALRVRNATLVFDVMLDGSWVFVGMANGEKC